jgi:CelD/BcsL family acetyltransferase involved in cellulose biosynthesis
LAITIRVITDMSKFQKIEKEFDDFAWKWSENPFLFSVFIKGVAGLSRLRGWIPLILVIYDSDKIVGMAPLAMRKKFGICFAQFLFNEYSLPDIVVNDEYREVCVSQVLCTLTNIIRCKFVDLTFSKESATLKSLKKASQALNVYYGAETVAGHRIVPVTCSWDEFVKMRGKKFRAEARRVDRKVGGLGDWRVACVEQIEQDPEVCEKILRINELSWKKEWLSSRGIVDDELAMILNIMRGTAKKEPIFKWQVYFLELNGIAIAYVLVFRHKGTAIIKKTAYDAAYKSFCPGIFIINCAIRHLFNDAKVKVIDFCADHSYMKTWAPLCLPRITAKIRKGLFLVLIERALVNTTTRRMARLVFSGVSKLIER